METEGISNLPTNLISKDLPNYKPGAQTLSNAYGNPSNVLSSDIYSPSIQNPINMPLRKP